MAHVRTFSMIPDSNTPFEWAEAAAAAAKVLAAFLLGLEALPPPPPPPVEELDDEDNIGFSRRHDSFDEFTSLASCK